MLPAKTVAGRCQLSLHALWLKASSGGGDRATSVELIGLICDKRLWRGICAISLDAGCGTLLKAKVLAMRL